MSKENESVPQAEPVVSRQQNKTTTITLRLNRVIEIEEQK